LLCDLTRSEILTRAETLSRRGKLPGFARTPGGFVATAFGEPFDFALHADVSNGRVRFGTSAKRLLPAIGLVVTALTVWPGVWLTDSLLRTYFPGYDYATWMWYLPLTIVPLPWAIRGLWRKSKAAAGASAHELIERLRAAMDGQLEGD